MEELKNILEEKAIAFAMELLQTEILKRGEACHMEEDSLLLDNQSLRLRLGFDGLEQGTGRVVSHMYVWADHPNLTDPIYEMCSAMGTTWEEAVSQSVMSFLYAAYSCWEMVFQEGWCSQFTTTVQGKERLWYLGGGLKALTGDEPEVNQDDCLWKVVEEDLKKYLGALKYYWIKIYIGVMNRENYSEVRINDIRVEALSKQLQEYADKLPIHGKGYYSQKQFFFLVQDESTFEPYPYSKGELEEKVTQTLQLKWQCYQENNQQKYYQGLAQICKEDDMLYIELECFLREMTAMYAYQNHKNFEQEIFAFRDGAMQETYYATQFTAYPWIYNKMLQIFHSAELPSELFSILLSESAIGHLVEESEEKGKEISAIRGFGIMDDDHVLKVR